MKAARSKLSAIGRRDFLTLSGGLAAGAVAGFGPLARASAGPAITAVMSGVLLPDRARAIVFAKVDLEAADDVEHLRLQRRLSVELVRSCETTLEERTRFDRIAE